GAGAGFMDVGRRQAPPLPPWPYDRLPVGEIVPPGRMPEAADQAIPTTPATGFNPARSALTLKGDPGGGKSLAVELFGAKK
ncbi:MAG: hypothetical protein WBF17_28230, partial [Phycisphaerae bacterium]